MTKLKVESNAIVAMTDRWTNKYYLANYCYNLKKSQTHFLNIERGRTLNIMVSRPDNNLYHNYII